MGSIAASVRVRDRGFAMRRLLTQLLAKRAESSCGCCRLAVFVLLVAFLHAGAAVANDSTASLDAGGLRLTYNPDISIESEDLFLSRDEIRVAYRFRNQSDRDIATLVAFPLPVMIIGEEGNYDLDGRDPVNVMDFQVTVEGEPVKPSVEIKATRFGVDVTDVLKRYDIPPTMIVSGAETGSALYDRLNDLPQEARAELKRYGVVDWNTSFGAGDKPLANTHWDTHIVYYWFQTFPAGRSIEVTHRYKPVPRSFFFSKEDLAAPETRKLYCMDQAFASAAEKALKQSPQNLLAGTELKYVLTTAGNWLGPIGKFKLTLEKPSPEALVSLCATAIKRTSPTTFTMSAEDYAPESDLNILFVQPLPQEP